MSDITSSPNRVLDYWLGPEAQRAAISPHLQKKWFEKRAETDAYIAREFGAEIERAGAGELYAWSATPRGRLALVILLDQMTRNVYRNSAKAFSFDAKALALAKDGIARGDDKTLHPAEQAFLYMPLMHSEVLADQEQACTLFKDLAVRSPSTDQERWAIAHRAIILRFGRFPHRNAILGRPSTAEELAFLNEPGSSF